MCLTAGPPPQQRPMPADPVDITAGQQLRNSGANTGAPFQGAAGESPFELFVLHLQIFEFAQPNEHVVEGFTSSFGGLNPFVHLLVYGHRRPGLDHTPHCS